MLGIADPAPDFRGRTQYGEDLGLPELAGRPAMIMFYPYAFSRVCSGELTALVQRHRDGPLVPGAQVLAVSCDAVHTLRAYAAELARSSGREEAAELGFPLLSDFWPHGRIARDFGVFDEARGIARRVSFLLDADQVVRGVQAAELGDARDLSAATERLAELVSR